MLGSTKIKFLGVIGTFVIISTAYVLHANTFYKELYPTLNSDATPIEPIKLQEPIIEQEKLKIEIINVEKIVEPNKNIEPIKNIIVKVIDQNKSIVKIVNKPTLLSPSAKLNQMLKKYKYIHIEKSGEISQETKDVLEKLIPLLSNIKDSYIELEGYSSYDIYSYITKKRSEQSAQIIYEYLNDRVKDKKIVVTGYGDRYPIIDDKNDERNSRVEIKIRRR